MRIAPLWLLLLAPAAQAQDASPWLGTRWLLSVEEVLPVAVNLQAVHNDEFLLKAFQLRTVVACNDVNPGKKVTILRCTFEDAAMQAVPHGTSPSERDLEVSLRAVEDALGRLRGSTLEVAINSAGKITRVDIPDIQGDNDREKQGREVLRQFATDLAMGWALKRPREWSGTWQEFNPVLVRAPGHSPAGGSSQVVHNASIVDGRTIVQTIGNGNISINYDAWELEGQARLISVVTPDTASGAGAGGLPGGVEGGGGAVTYGGRVTASGAAPSASTPETRTYDVSVRSVAAVDPAKDMLIERVWAIAGAGTASSVDALEGVTLWYNGHLRMLADGESPDLGPTRMISAPGQPVEGLEAWSPMDG